MNAKLARYLLDIGLGADEIVGALEAVENGSLHIYPPLEQTPADRKRARDAARMREKRQSRDVAATVVASPHTPINNTSIPQSPSETTPRKTKGQTALPVDFTIDEPVYAYAAEKYSLSRAEADECLEAMKNWAWGKGIRRADWTRTLYGFFRTESQKRGNAPKATPFIRGDRNAPTIQQTANALADWTERRAAGGG